MQQIVQDRRSVAPDQKILMSWLLREVFKIVLAISLVSWLI